MLMGGQTRTELLFNLQSCHLLIDIRLYSRAWKSMGVVKGLATKHETKKKLTRSRLGKCVAVAIVACSATMILVGHRMSVAIQGEFSRQQAWGGSSLAEDDSDVSNRGDLKWDEFGGPPDASDVVYWRDSPQDRKKRSPYSSRSGGRKKYLTVVRAVS